MKLNLQDKLKTLAAKFRPKEGKTISYQQPKPINGRVEYQQPKTN